MMVGQKSLCDLSVSGKASSRILKGCVLPLSRAERKGSEEKPTEELAEARQEVPVLESSDERSDELQ